MASELLSFRLSGSELDWLRSQQEDGETLNLTAKRLLLSLMNGTVDITVDTSVDTPVDTMGLEQRLEKRIEEKIDLMYQQIVCDLNYVLDKRLSHHVDTTVNTVDITVNTPVDTPVDTPVYTHDKPLESYTIIELRAIAKKLEIPFKVRDNKAKLINMISARKSEENPCHHVQ